MASRVAIPLLLLANRPSWAQAVGNSASQATSSGGDLGGTLLQLILGLGGVLLLLVGTLWVIKKLMMQRGGASGLLRVVSGTAVGARERVVIVEVGSTWLVLGVAPGRVTALAEIPRQSIPTTPNVTEQRGFPDWLKNMSLKK